MVGLDVVHDQTPVVVGRSPSARLSDQWLEPMRPGGVRSRPETGQTGVPLPEGNSGLGAVEP